VVSGPTIGVLALQGAFREHRRIFEGLGARARLVRSADEMTGLDGLAIPGGESTAMSRLAVDLGVLEPVRDAVAAGLPAFGTCAGMIMLARRILDGRPDQRTFGGLDITVRRNAFGRQVESFEAPVPMAELGPPDYPGVFIRAPLVEQIGPGVQVWGEVPQAAPPGGTRIVAVRQGSVLATAFHPELTDDDRIHRKFLSMIR
jgi:5'-phosphate synthase pdxT subunit